MAACTKRAGLTLQQMQHQVAQNRFILQQLQRDLHVLRTIQSDQSKKDLSLNASFSSGGNKINKNEENFLLQQKVKDLLHEVLVAEMLNGERQILPPTFSPTAPSSETPVKEEVKDHSTKPSGDTKVNEKTLSSGKNKMEKPLPNDQPATAEQKVSTPVASKEKPESKAPAASVKKPAGGTENESTDVHVGRLDMRIGRIVEVMKHPDADTLYVEKVDVGEDNPRTIVSGLVKHVPIEQMNQRLAVFLCNLKPAKMRNVLSEGMIMCASCSKNGVVQILEVPSNCVPGDRIFVPGYEMTPDTQMNPKKKILETVKPELRVNDDGVACYRGVPWEVQDNKGRIKAPSVTDAAIQ